MLIGFIGCPCSGKTTTAAMTFADLKQMGVNCEFVPEQARVYIAKKKMKDGPSVTLDDVDQLNIMLQQEELEEVIDASVSPGTVVVADSSVFNTLLYFQDFGAHGEMIHRTVLKGLKRYDILFYCAPFEFKKDDPLRVHDQKQSLEIDKKIPEMIQKLDLKPVLLFGDPKERHHQVIRAVLEASLALESTPHE